MLSWIPNCWGRLHHTSCYVPPMAPSEFHLLGIAILSHTVPTSEGSLHLPSPRLDCHKSHAITCSSPDSQGLGMVTGNCCYCCYSDLHLLGTITLNFLVPPGYGSLCHMLALANLSVMVPSSYISF